MRLDLSLTPGAVRGAAAAPSSGPAIRASTSGVGGDPALPAHQAGDVLLVGAVYPGFATPTAAGWTRIVAQNEGSGDWRLVVFSKEAVPGSDTTLSPSANPAGPWIAVADRDATAVDAVVAGTAGSGTAITCPSVNVTTAPALLHDFILGYGDTTPAITVPAGETTVAHVQDGGLSLALALGVKAVTAAGATGTRAAASSVTVARAVGAVAVR